MYTTAANSLLIQVKRKKKERDDSSEIRLGLIETRTRSLRLRQYEHWWRSILMLYGINGWILRIFLYLFLYSWYPKRPPPFFLCVCVSKCYQQQTGNNNNNHWTITVEWQSSIPVCVYRHKRNRRDRERSSLETKQTNGSGK